MKTRRMRWASLRALFMVFVMVAAAVTGLAVTAPPAQAAPGNILPPFNVGEQWWICQGYNTTRTHNGTSAYGLDLVGGPACDNSASGRTVRAPLSGTVFYYQAAYGNLCVNVVGGRSYTLTHINSGITGGSITAGQAVGTVAAAGQRSNNGVAHIHFQMWSTANCYSSSGIPFDSAHGARICGAPDLTVSGPSGGNGVWSGENFVGARCGEEPSEPGRRIGVLSNDDLNVKEGAINNAWTTLGRGSAFELSPRRIALYNGSTLSVKEGELSSVWTVTTGRIDEFHVTDNRVGVRIGTQIFVKEGSIESPWIHVTDGVSFAMSSNRLAVYNGNYLSIKEGGLSAGWTAVAGQVDEFHITDNRIGIRVGSGISVKDGPLSAEWIHVTNGQSFMMSSTRLAVYNGTTLDIKEGALNASWITISGQVDAFDVTDHYIGALVSGQLFVKDEAVNAPWVLIGGGSSFDLS